MKIKSTFKVQIEDPEGKAIVEFKKPKRNQALKDEVKAENKDSKDYIKMVLDSIVSLEGISAEDGTPLSVQALKECDDEVLVSNIFWAYVTAWNGLRSMEAAEKKVSVIN